jgi:hypothetical protein
MFQLKAAHRFNLSKRMNPPPIPPSARKKSSFASQAATASLIAPILAIVLIGPAKAGFQDMQDAAMVNVVIDLACALLIIIGILFGILGLVRIPEYGPKGILGKGIAGLAINGILILIFAANVLVAHQKKLQARTAALAKVKSVEAEIRVGNQKALNSKSAITNGNSEQLDRLSSALQSASTNLSGDEALVSQAMAAHFSRLHDALTNYEAAALEVRNAHILNHFSTTDKGQFAARRQIVERFLQANADLTGFITNSENHIIADLTKSHVSNSYIKKTMEHFHANAAPLNAVSLRIRACDDRVGAAMLDALNLLEADWYKWTINPKNGNLRFEDPKDLEAYNKIIRDMKTAGEDQLKFQQQLARLQQTVTTP